jgi:4-oxalocrotonate tautomerase
MPIIQVNLMEGRSDEQKEALIAALTDATVQSLGAPRDSVRVLLNEMPKTHWGIGGKSAKALGR